MTIYFQDPDAQSPEYLLEKLLAASSDSIGGGALFAFATRGGVRLLLDDPLFRKFLRTSPFEIIVGVDATTNVAALDALADAQKQNPKLKTRVFYHDRRITFHPKVTWFAHKKGGTTVLVGSGNLTTTGLSGNWEAYGALSLGAAEAKKLRTDWDDWIKRHEARLYDVADEAVRARAAKNRLRIHRDKRAAEDLPSKADDSTQVLLAEIPKSGDRWKQANFSLEIFTSFFGGDTTESHRLFLWRLRPDGKIEGLESRPTVAVKSRNFRIELEAAAGLAYPTTGRPIGAFVRIAVRKFRYMLLMPGQAGHDRASAMLDAHAKKVAGRMRSVVLSLETVREEWPDTPLVSIGSSK